MDAHQSQTVCHESNFQVAKQAVSALENDQTLRLSQLLVAPNMVVPDCSAYPAIAVERFLKNCEQTKTNEDEDDDQQAIDHQLDMEMSRLADATAGMSIQNGKQRASYSAGDEVSAGPLPTPITVPNSSSSVHTLRYYGHMNGSNKENTAMSPLQLPPSMLAALPEGTQNQQLEVPEFKVFSVNLCDLNAEVVSQIEGRIYSWPLNEMARIVGRTIPSPLSASPTEEQSSNLARLPLAEIENNSEVQFRPVSFGRTPSPASSSSDSVAVDAAGQLEIHPSTVFKWVRIIMQHDIPTAVDELVGYSARLEAIHLIVSILKEALGGSCYQLGNFYLREAIATHQAPLLLDLHFDGYNSPKQWGREFVGIGSDIYQGPNGATPAATIALLQERVVSLVLAEWVVVADSLLTALGSEIGARLKAKW